MMDSNYTFKGIVKSQMLRLRKLCPQNKEFLAVEKLRERDASVDEILNDAGSPQRVLSEKSAQIIEKEDKIRWVTLAHSNSENEI